LDINQISTGFKILDQKSLFESGANKSLATLLMPECLSMAELHNEMSHQEQRASSRALLDINQGFDNN
jgi:hypothetical protein